MKPNRTVPLLSQLPLLAGAVVLGAAAWLLYPELVTTKERPYDEESFWFCMIALGAVLGIASPARGWLTGLALMLPQLALLGVDLARVNSPYWWRGFLVYVAFTALVTCAADLTATARRLVLRLLPETTPRATYAGEL